MGTINHWGGIVPDGMSWSHYHYKKGEIEKWQYHLYLTWYNHGKDIHGFGDPAHTKNYVGTKFAKEFYDFGYFVSFIKKDPLFSQFRRNPDAYDIDKDSLYKEWSPRSVKIVTEATNVNLVNKDKGREVKATDPNGNVTIISSTREAERVLNIPQGTIGSRCRGPVHLVKKGKFKGWSFEYC